MNEFVLGLSYYVIDTEGFGFYLVNKKGYVNKFSDEIEEIYPAGDIAGIIINKLNTGENLEIEGTKNSTLKNVLYVEEYDEDEIQTLKENNKNYIRRQGNEFTLEGNFVNKEDPSEKLNLRIIKVYIRNSIKRFMKEYIFSSVDITIPLEKKLEEIKNNVKKYMKGFYYEIEQENETIEIILYESYNTPIDKIKFLLDFSQINNN